MSERKASETAWGVMLLRAAHMLMDDAPAILNDPIAVRLAGPRGEHDVEQYRDRFRDPASLMLRAHVVIRSRFAEAMLEEAVARGVTQCIVLGAGYDTFAYRQPAWARSLKIFEVDHPASQQAKREKLREAGITIPANVIYAPIDFEEETLSEGLDRAGFDAQLQTFVSCLGVLVYLTPEAVEGVFRFVVSLAPGSEIVATFKSRSDGPQSRVAAAAAAMGEPWLSEFDPAELAARLRTLGFGSVEMVNGAELAARYAAERKDGVRPRDGMQMLRARR